jgi:hypothetical protein
MNKAGNRNINIDCQVKSLKGNLERIERVLNDVNAQKITILDEEGAFKNVKFQDRSDLLDVLKDVAAYLEKDKKRISSKIENPRPNQKPQGKTRGQRAGLNKKQLVDGETQKSEAPLVNSNLPAVGVSQQVDASWYSIEDFSAVDESRLVEMPLVKYEEMPAVDESQLVDASSDLSGEKTVVEITPTVCTNQFSFVKGKVVFTTSNGVGFAMIGRDNKCTITSSNGMDVRLVSHNKNCLVQCKLTTGLNFKFNLPLPFNELFLKAKSGEKVTFTSDFESRILALKNHFDNGEVTKFTNPKVNN